MSIFFNLHFLQNLIYPFLEISSKVVQILDVLFFHKKVVYEICTKITRFLEVYENCMVVFVLKIAKIARFLYGIVQNLYKNWTIFFHRALVA